MTTSLRPAIVAKVKVVADAVTEVCNNRDLTVAILKIVAGSRFDAGPVATRFMNRAFPDHDLRHGSRTVKSPTARTNRFMHKLRVAGLVEGVDGRHGGIRWWRITDAGRTFLRDHAS